MLGTHKSLHRTPDPLRVEFSMATQPLTLFRRCAASSRCHILDRYKRRMDKQKRKLIARKEKKAMMEEKKAMMEEESKIKLAHLQ